MELEIEIFLNSTLNFLRRYLTNPRWPLILYVSGLDLNQNIVDLDDENHIP